MRLSALLVVAAITLGGCSSDTSSGPTADRPTTVSLTPDERTAFLAAVADLGFTCRDALPDDPALVACTRPGVGQEAYVDTVRLTASPTGEVLRVSYCGPDPEVYGAFSTAFLAEIGSPSALPAPGGVTGTRIRECYATSGLGFAAGGEVTTRLRDLDLPATWRTLGATGWSCGDEPQPLDCTRGEGDDRTIAMGAGDSLTVSAPDPAALGAAADDLGLDPAVARAAAGCATDGPCEHLVVDGYDVTLSTAGSRSRMEVAALPWL